MTPGSGGADGAVLARLETLGAKLDEVSGHLAEVAKSSKETRTLAVRVEKSLNRTRRLALGLAVSFGLDIVLTVVLGLTALQAHGTASTNAQLVQELHVQQVALNTQQVALHNSQLTSCANGNVFRADQTTIWRDFIGLLTKPAAGETPAQVARTNQLAAQFLKYVVTVNKPIDCSAVDK